jgi:hypothetical protein
MKKYLILENGSQFAMDTCQSESNIMGIVSIEHHMLRIKDPISGKAFSTTLETAISNQLSSLLKSHETVLGKIVVDALPIDYHLYDLKTVIM